MSKKQIKNKQTETAAPTIIQELYMPRGMKLLVGLLWIAGLSGLVLGLFTVVQAASETFWDIQIYFTIESVGLLAFGSVMFMLAVTMLGKQSWTLATAKITSIALVGWSVPAIILGIYAAWSSNGFDSALIMYGTVGWLLGFGAIMGIPTFNYLHREGSTLMKYIRYSPPEMYVPAPAEKQPERKRLPEIKPYVKTIRCIDCGSEVSVGSTVCPICGATQIRKRK